MQLCESKSGFAHLLSTELLKLHFNFAAPCHWAILGCITSQVVIYPVPLKFACFLLLSFFVSSWMFPVDHLHLHIKPGTFWLLSAAVKAEINGWLTVPERGGHRGHRNKTKKCVSVLHQVFWWISVGRTKYKILNCDFRAPKMLMYCMFHIITFQAKGAFR